mgnify:FL=1
MAEEDCDVMSVETKLISTRIHLCVTFVGGKH